MQTRIKPLGESNTTVLPPGLEEVAGSRTLDEETHFFKPWNPNPCRELPTLERFKGTETNKGDGRFTPSTHVHSGACAHSIHASLHSKNMLMSTVHKAQR